LWFQVTFPAIPITVHYNNSKNRHCAQFLPLSVICFVVRFSSLTPGHLVFIIMHSPEEDAAPTHALLLQVHSILLSTLSSIGRGQLTVGDAICAFRLTSSPITSNIVWWCVGSLYSKLRRRESHTRRKPFVIGFSVLLIPVWIVLFNVITLSRTAFKDSDRYGHGGSTYIIQLLGIFSPISSPLLLNPAGAGWVMFWPALLQWLLLVIWILYTVRHARDILEWKARNEKRTSFWKRLKLIFKSIWYVGASHNHAC
jgi:tryptophan-rich sensory protein